MSKPRAPEPPDPKETSAAATGTSVATAIANANLQNVNQVTPNGSLSYSQTGTYTMTDPYTGKTYQVPRFTATQTLSEMGQKINDQQQGASLNLATLGNNLSGTLGQQLTGNFKLGNEAVEGRLMELGSKRLDPLFAQREEQTRQNLIARGIRPGSAAYEAEMTNFNQGRNDAYNQLLLQGRGQASQELLTEDNQRINQIGALLSGGQVSQPNFMNTNMPTIPTTDNAGLINNHYNQQMQAYQQQMAQSNSLLGGLFGLGGKIIGLSDDDAKKDKERLGDVEGKMGLWEFRYKGEPKSGKKHVGLMASEVEKVHPDAVHRGKDGYRRVDYGKALGLAGM
jgi:hypothetical protein